MSIPNQQAALSCEEMEAAERVRMYRRLAAQQNINSGLFGYAAGAQIPQPTPGPYQSESLNRKLQDAKEWLASRGKWEVQPSRPVNHD